MAQANHATEEAAARVANLDHPTGFPPSFIGIAIRKMTNKVAITMIAHTTPTKDNAQCGAGTTRFDNMVQVVIPPIMNASETKNSHHSNGSPPRTPNRTRP